MQVLGDRQAQERGEHPWTRKKGGRAGANGVSWQTAAKRGLPRQVRRRRRWGQQCVLELGLEEGWGGWGAMKCRRASGNTSNGGRDACATRRAGGKSTAAHALATCFFVRGSELLRPAAADSHRQPVTSTPRSSRLALSRSSPSCRTKSGRPAAARRRRTRHACRPRASWSAAMRPTAPPAAPPAAGPGGA